MGQRDWRVKWGQATTPANENPDAAATCTFWARADYNRVSKGRTLPPRLPPTYQAAPLHAVIVGVDASDRLPTGNGIRFVACRDGRTVGLSPGGREPSERDPRGRDLFPTSPRRFDWHDWVDCHDWATGMNEHSVTLRRLLLAILPCLLLSGGCGKPEPITGYTVEKRARANRAAPDRMLGAIILHGRQGWFFKITGPIETVAKQEEAFAAFIKSVRFVGQGAATKPQWKLAEGWREQAGTGMRYATVQIGDAGQRLEMSVIRLPRETDYADAYVLKNVIRWLDQMGLGADLKETSTQFDWQGDPVTMVSIVGKQRAGGPGMGRSMLPPDHPPIQQGGGQN